MTSYQKDIFFRNTLAIYVAGLDSFNVQFTLYFIVMYPINLKLYNSYLVAGW